MTRSEELISRVRIAAHHDREEHGEGTELQVAALALAEEYAIVVRIGVEAVTAVHELVKTLEK